MKKLIFLSVVLGICFSTPVGIPCTVVPDLMIPPSNLIRTAYSATPKQITLGWQDNANNEGAYLVEKSDDGGLTWDTVKELPANSTSATIGLVGANVLSYFRVQGELGGMGSSYSNVISLEGTDPTIADTDGDGMIDAFEVTNSLDPYVNDAYQDADGDRYPNIFEYIKGSDVADAQSVPASDFVVDPTIPAAGNVYNTFAGAFGAVNADNQIIAVKNGTYSGSSNINLNFPSSHSILLISESGASNVVLDGQDATRIFIVATDSVIDGFTFRNGAAATGGSILIQGGSPMWVNCVFLDNTATTSGGAIHQDAGDSLILHSTFARNSAPVGSAIAATTGSVTIDKSILWNSGVSELDVASGVSNTVSESIVRLGYTGMGNLASDPFLTEDGHLTLGSPAIDQGGILTTSLIDLDGEARPAGTTTDLGADEYIDVDSDGLPDWWEIARFGVVNSAAIGAGDADGDGLSNLQEYQNGTSPNSSDSDGDGMPDNWEVAHGLNPRVNDASVDSDGDGYSNLFEYQVGLDPSHGDSKVQISSGDNHSLLLKADGTVWSWGNNAYGQLGDGTTTARTTPMQVSGLSGVVSVGAGSTHSLAVKSDGTVWSWGDNGSGRLGDGTTTTRTAPVQVSGLSGVVSVGAGGSHSLAVKSDGTVWAWGDNAYGQLGDGTTTTRTTPVQVSGLSGVVSVGAGSSHSLAVKADGTVWAWGNNSGRLGDGTTTNRAAPVQVSGLSGVVSVGAGGSHSLAVKSDGTVWAWGNNGSGRLGDGTTTTRTTPVQVSGLSGVVSVGAGSTHSLAVKSDGTVCSWGNNGYDQLGDGALTSWTTPVQVSGLSGVVSVGAGTSHSLAVKSDGTVWAWGGNSGSGQLGDGTTTTRTTPVQVSGLSGVVSVGAGGSHSLAVKADGTVWSWGNNGSGRLGDGTTTTRTTPVQVSGLSGVVSVGAGSSHSLAVKSDGTVWSWGNNGSGQLGDGTTTNRTTPVQVSGLSGVVSVRAGSTHSLAVKSDGTVWSWGNNGSGQLGDGTTTTRTAPVQVSGLSGMVSVVAGGNHSLAVKSDGTVWAWGSSTPWTTPVQVSGLSGVVSVGAGSSHSLAVKSDGTVWSWGNNGSGQLGDGTTFNRTTPVQANGSIGMVSVGAGSTHSLAVKSDGTVCSWGGNGSGVLGIGGLLTRSSVDRVLNINAFRAVADLTVIAPANNSSVVLGDSVNTQVSLSPGFAPTEKVEFYNERIKIGESTQAPWSWNWTPNTWGEFHLSAIAIDAEGNRSLSSNTVTVIVPYDSDENDLPDWWELKYFGDLGNVSGADSDGDGLTNAQELTQGSEPDDYYSQGNTTITPVISMIGGNNQMGLPGEYLNEAFSVEVRNGSGGPLLANAPISFSVLSGGGELSGAHGAPANVGVLTLRTDGGGIARAYYRQSGLADVASQVVSKAGQSNSINFSGTTKEYVLAFAPNGGGYSKVDVVKLASDMIGGQIHYTLNGNDPSVSDPSVSPNRLLRVPQGVALKASGWIGENRVTPIVSATYDRRGRVRAGPDHTFAIKPDGSLWFWGKSTRGERGLGPSGNQWFARRIHGFDGVKDAIGSNAHSLVVNGDGHVWGAGHNYYGQLGIGTNTDEAEFVELSGIDNVVALAAGERFSLALKSDGSVWAWGDNSQSQLGDGTTQSSNVPVAVSGLGSGSGVVDIAAGINWAMALKDDGTLWVWGNGWSGALGIGVSGNGVIRATPELVTSINDIVAISAGDEHSLVLVNDGSVWCSGRNFYGQLGRGSYAESNSFVKVSGLEGVIAISAGDSHSAAVTSDGTVVAWGRNDRGQLGDGTVTGRNVPVTVEGITDAISVDAGTHTLIVREDGRVWGTGNNEFGQIGDGTMYDRNLAVEVDDFTLPDRVKRPSLSPDGGKYLTGQAVTIACETADAEIHYTTNGSEPTKSDPLIISGNAIAISQNCFVRVRAFKDGSQDSPIKSAAYHIGGRVNAAVYHSLAIKADGSLWVWGRNFSGQLGIGNVGGHSGISNVMSVRNPARHPDFERVRDAAGNWDHSLVVDDGGDVWAFGNNFFGALGDGTTTSRNRPAKVIGINDVSAVTAGERYSVALRSDGSVWAWGENMSGAMGVDLPIGAQTSTPMPVLGFGPGSGVIAIDAGSTHTMALKADGSVWAWGGGYEGQLGIGESGNGVARTAPVLVGTIDNVISISAGNNHGLALKADGTVWSVGGNFYGQLGTGSSPRSSVFTRVETLTDIISIAAGYEHSMAVKKDGTVLTWGRNDYGQLGDGTTGHRSLPTSVGTLSEVLDVSGGLHSMIMRRDGTLAAFGYNEYGQLGDGTSVNRLFPVGIGGFSLGQQVGHPTFSIESGFHLNGLTVAISSPTTGASIRYTTDGSNPDETDAVIASGGSVTIDRTSVLRARAFKPGLAASETKSAAYQVGARVAAGDNNSFAIKPDETLWAWGRNSNGQLGIGSNMDHWVPRRVSGVPLAKDVAVGAGHCVVVKSDGTVWAFGENAYGVVLGTGTTQNQNLPIQVSGLSDVVRVSAGYHFSLALKNDGSVWSWGLGANGRLGDGSSVDRAMPTIVSGFGVGSGVVSITCRNSSALALKSDGTLWGWGSGSNGVLGNGGNWPAVPEFIGSINDVVAVAMGEEHSVALKGDGTVWCTGYNSNGQLGLGDTTSRNAFTQVPGLSGVVAIGAGRWHTVALKTDGTVVAWGRNSDGQLGDGSTMDRNAPVAVGGLVGITGVSGGTHTLAISGLGLLWSVGDNSFGQLGDATNIDRNVPVVVEGFVSGPQVDRPVLTPDGGVYLQSQNVTVSNTIAGATMRYTRNGMEPTESDPEVPSNGIVQISQTGMLRVKAYKEGLSPSASKSAAYRIGGHVMANRHHSMAVKSDGTLWAWGANGNGQLGLGSTLSQLYPTRITSLSSVKDGSAGYLHSLVVDSAGKVWSFGDNWAGALGDGSSTQRTAPVEVTGLTSDVRSVAAGEHFSVGLKEDGMVYAWGVEWNGRLGNGTGVYSNVPSAVIGLGAGSGSIAIAAGAGQAFALKADGTLWGWGYNGTGSLGDGTTSDRTSPILIGTMSDAVAISAGQYHSVALKADGTVWCTGYNNYGQLGTGDTNARNVFTKVNGLENVVAIAAGLNHSLALKGDGSLVAWGRNDAGQLGDGTTVSRSSPVSVINMIDVVGVAAGDHSLVNTEAGEVLGFGRNSDGEIGDGSVVSRSSATMVDLIMGDEIAVPTFDVEGGSYLGTVEVNVQCATPGATIRYTTNGMRPTEIDTEVLNGGTVVVDRTCVLRARAFKAGFGKSYVKSAGYQIGARASAGADHSLVIMRDGSLWSWGRNTYGQLGIGDPRPYSNPRKLAFNADVRDLASGWNHSVIIDGNGKVWAFGYNYAGELGDGTGARQSAPVGAVGLSIGGKEVAAGEHFSVALMSNGSVFAWGVEWGGRLGNGTGLASNIPVPVSGLGSGSGISKIAAGAGHAFALKNDGTLWAWGSNGAGALGDGTTADRTTPILIETIRDVVAISAGQSHSVALRADGTVWCAGYNAYGQLGTGDIYARHVFTQVPGLYNVIQVVAGLNHSVAVKADGTVAVWGRNDSGQLGDGSVSNRMSPVVLSGIANVVGASAGEHTLFTRSNGAETFWGTGNNVYNQLADLTLVNQSVPKFIDLKYPDSDGDGLQDWLQIEMGIAIGDIDANGNGFTNAEDIAMGYDPLDEDLDGDGVSNVDEILQGYNPYSEDTDGDGVADGLDAFPLDPTRWEPMGPSDPNDHDGPIITITNPPGAVLVNP